MAANDRVVCSRKRFTVSDDIKLLKEVCAEHPFRDPSRWILILESLNAATLKDFTLRAIKERLDLLMIYFMREDRANLRKSGTEEEFDERERLLQDICDLARECGYKPKVARPRNTPSALARAAVASHAKPGQPATSVSCGRARREQKSAAAARNAAAFNACATSSQVDSDCPEEQSPAALLLLQAYAEESCDADDTSPSYIETPNSDGTRPATEQQPQPAASRPVRFRGRQKDVREGYRFLQQRAQQEKEQRESELELESRKLALEEERLGLDRLKHEDATRIRLLELELQRKQQEDASKVRFLELELQKSQWEKLLAHQDAQTAALNAQTAVLRSLLKDQAK